MDTDFTISGEEYFETLDRRFFFVWLKSTQKQGQRAKSFDLYIMLLLENLKIEILYQCSSQITDNQNRKHFAFCFADSLIQNDLERVVTSALG